MLLEAVRTRNEELAQTWRKSEQWATVEQLCSEWAHGTQGGLGPHRSVAGGPALVHNSCVLLEWTYLTREAASRGWEGISLRQPGPLSPGTVGVQLPGLQEYGAAGSSAHDASAAMWACQHCTFMNQPGTGHCEMCSLPRA